MPYVRPPITPPLNVLKETGPIGAQGTAQPDQAAAPTEAKGAPSQASTHEVTPETPPEGIPEEPPETPEPTRPRVPVRDIPEPTDTAHAAAPEAETGPEPKKPRRPRSAVRDLTRPTSE